MPKLLGKAPNNRNSAWGRLECYVPPEDRYHPAKSDADDNALDTSDLKKWSFKSCKLACPCNSEDVLPEVTSLLQSADTRDLAALAYVKQRSGLINVAAMQNGGKCVQQSSSFADEGIDGGFGCSLLIDGDRTDGYYSAWA